MHDAQGRPLSLGELLGRGGEGEVYTVEGAPELVAKILLPARRTQAKHDKIQAMLRRPPEGAYDAPEGLAVLSWPRGILYDAPGATGFVGYTMARIQSADFVPFYNVTSARRRQRLGGAVGWDRLVLLGARLCHVVRTLHRFGYAVGDLNDRNVLVSRRFTPLLMDTDSFQVPKRGGHFPSTVGDQLYWPPELLGVDLTTHRKSRIDGDRFALATLLFQLFMDGNRPYQARGTRVAGLDTLMAKTQAGHFPWDRPVPGVLEPPAGAPSFDCLPPSLRRGFIQAFVAGHGQPQRRPTADWWYDALAGLVKEGFQTCPVESRHMFGAKQTTCPWCAEANDPFTLSTARRAARARSTAAAVRAHRAATPAAAPAALKAPAPRPAATAGRRPPNPASPKSSAATARRKTAAAPSPTAGKTPGTAAKRATTTSRPTKGRPPTGAASGAKSAARATQRTRAPSTARPAPARAKMAAARRIESVHAPPPGVPWGALAAWAATIALAVVAPFVWSLQLPAGPPKRAIAATLSVLALAGPVTWLAARRTTALVPRIAWACASGLVAVAIAGAAAGLDAWTLLETVAGIASLAAAAGVFLLLERHRGGARRHLVHAVAGLPVAYLPILAWWAAVAVT